MDNSHLNPPQTDTTIRTLIVAGYSIEDSNRHPRHIEILCKRTDILGSSIPYLIAVTDVDEFTETEIEDIRNYALNQCRIPVIVAATPIEGTISWEDFIEALGGAVQSWQVLKPEYDQALLTAAKNQLPADVADGEPWLIFEDLVGYGLEFIFGRRVSRLGGRVRGRPVSDIQVQIPTGPIIIVDTKASSDGFNVTWPNLRPLVEYVKRQHIRQRGQVELIGALLLSSNFKQDDIRLSKLSQEFWGEVQVPLSFFEANDFVETINLFRKRPDIRNGIRWNQIFYGGRIRINSITKEMRAVDDERIRSGV